jgi:hypothetical protein
MFSGHYKTYRMFKIFAVKNTIGAKRFRTAKENVERESASRGIRNR